MNTLYPLFMNIEHRPVLVVGGGAVAEQKLKGLLEANADITVLAPQATETIEGFARNNKIRLLRRKYIRDDVKGFFIVVGATSSRSVQEQIFNDSQDHAIPVNIVDVPDLCTFYLSSVFQKGNLKIAVSTNGKSPTLGKIIRDKIKTEFSEGYPELLETIGDMRPEVRNSLLDYECRKKFYEHVVRSELQRLSHSIGTRTVQKTVDSLRCGKVYLIGAGPGDPELMTVKGMKILTKADVILYDALVNENLLSFAPDSSEKIFVGKRAGMRCRRQEEINELLILKAGEGKCVVRLKGGDPLIFGRGGEELEALHIMGIEVEVVPGITAGIGVPTSLGVPLTHRRDSSSIVFLTGHEDPAKTEARIDWQSVSHVDTIVIYMGVKSLHSIIESMVQNGVSPSKPIAIIFAGTLPEETVIVGTLLDIEEQCRDIFALSPGLIIIGSVVRFLIHRDHRERTTQNYKALQMEITQ
jgi:uroporphyrin-III C-methyltransferase / precorrin-2 dehydrogenase / sirohydrochlorin ferrochelatase